MQVFQHLCFFFILLLSGGLQAFMQCPAELVYQEVILQPEKMVQWNRTVSACQVRSLSHRSLCWRRLCPPDAAVTSALSSDPSEGWWQHPVIIWRVLWSSGRSCVCQVPQCSKQASVSQYLALPQWVTGFSPLRDFVNVRRVERKRDCYMSAGMATIHESKPPCSRFVRSEHVSTRPVMPRLFPVWPSLSLCSCWHQGRKRSRRVCGPQVQQQPVCVHLHLGPQHRPEGTLVSWPSAELTVSRATQIQEKLLLLASSSKQNNEESHIQSNVSCLSAGNISQAHRFI